MPIQALAAVWLVALGVAPAVANDTLVAEIEQRLERGGADAVNAWLVANWVPAMQPLTRSTAECELPAVSLALRLARGTQARAVEAHNEALRAAAGRCPRFVLALAQPAQVVRVCASQPSWGPAQTARELRRRMADIDADATLRGSKAGQTCRAAYRYELEHTRVVVRRVP